VDAIPSDIRAQAHEVAALAGRQENVIARSQLRELGFSTSKVNRWVAGRRLFRRYRGVYSLTPTLSRLGEFWAAVLAYWPDAVLSHESAAHVHGIRRHAWGPPHVTVPRTGVRSKPGTRAHSSAALTSVVVNGLPITDVTRTLTDLADTLTPSAHRQAVATAERKELIDRTMYTPLPGRKAFMDKPHLFTRSENERAMFALCERYGLTLPLVNQRIGTWEVDFYWPEWGFAIELDCWFTHRDPITFERDRLKDEDLDVNHAIKVRRVTDTRLHGRPDDVARLIRAAERSARAGRARSGPSHPR
jgi:hypothetical protein